MSPTPSGVMAAPNKCRIEARVLRAEQDAQFSDKWQFTLEVLESQSVEGPHFARIGERIRAFTIVESSSVAPADITPQVIIPATAEFLGDARGSVFQLSDIQGAGTR